MQATNKSALRAQHEIATIYIVAFFVGVMTLLILLSLESPVSEMTDLKIMLSVIAILPGVCLAGLVAEVYPISKRTVLVPFIAFVTIIALFFIVSDHFKSVDYFHECNILAIEYVFLSTGACIDYVNINPDVTGEELLDAFGDTSKTRAVEDTTEKVTVDDILKRPLNP